MKLSEQILHRLPTGKLATNSLQAIFGQGLRAFVQGINFILITRFLEAEQFGLFTASFAIVLIFACFSAIAFPYLLVIEVSKQPDSAPGYYLRSLLYGGITAPFLILFTFITHTLIIADPELLLPLLLLCLSELVFHPVLESTARVYQAFEQMRITSRIQNAAIYSRFLIICSHFIWADELTILQVSVYYCLASGIAALVVLIWGVRNIGISREHLSGLRIKLGLLMASSHLAHKSILDIDKTIIAALQNAQITGIYAAGYRLVELTIIPARGVLETAYNRFMRAGNEGIETSFRYSLRILPWPLSYSVVIAVALYWFSPLINWLLGDSFAGTEQVIQLFCFYPILFTLRQSLVQVIESSQLIYERLVIFSVTALVNLVFTVVWVMQYGWQGAIWATYMAEGCLLVLSLFYIFRQIQIERHE